MKRQLGLFGGSFNPIHFGHLHLAKSVKQALRLERVVMMPTGEAPHKSSAEYEGLSMGRRRASRMRNEE